MLTYNRKSVNPLKYDPSGTASIRKAFASEIDKRFNALRRAVTQLIVDQDVFGLKPYKLLSFNESVHNVREWVDLTDEQKLENFRNWLADQIGQGIITVSAKGSSEWFYQYIVDSYQKAYGKAYDQVRTKSPLARMAQEAYFQRYGQVGSVSSFYAGSKEEFLRSAFGQPVPIERVKFLASRTYTDLKGVTDAMSQQMSRVLVDGLIAGDNPRTIAKALNDRVDKIGKTRAKMVSHDAVIRTHAEAMLDSFESMGVDNIGVAVEWSTSHLGVTAKGYPSPCELCKPLEGIVMSVKEARGMIPRHPYCVTGDSIIEADDIRVITRAKYTGKIFDFVTRKGRRFSVTENHILLSEFGFIPAKFIYKGLNIIDASIVDGDSLCTPYDDCRKSSIADIFRSLWESRDVVTASVPTSAEYLHGDGCFIDSEIDVVYVDGVLRDNVNVAHVRKDFFPLGESSAKCSFVVGDGPEFLRLSALASSFDGSMGRCRDALAILLGRLLHANRHRLGAVAGSDSVLFELPVDAGSSDIEMLSDCLDAHPVMKHFDCFVNRERNSVVVVSSSLNAEHVESAADGTVLHVETLGDIKARHPRLMHQPDFFKADFPKGLSGFAGFGHDDPYCLDEIVRISVRGVTGFPVFDVTTASTLYRLNGILSSNCRCSIIPVNVESEKQGQVREASGIRKAIKESVKAERPKKTKRTIAEQRERSSWPGAKKKISKNRPRGIY